MKRTFAGVQTALSLAVLLSCQPIVHLSALAGDKTKAVPSIVAQQQRLWQQCTGLWAAKKYSEALAAIDQIARLQKTLHGRHSHTMAFVESVRTELENDRGDWRLVSAPRRELWILCQLEQTPVQKDSATQTMLEQVLMQREKQAGKDSVWAALARMDLAWHAQQTGSLDSASANWKSSAELLSKLATDNTINFRLRNLINSSLAEARLRQAGALLKSNQINEARALAEENAKKHRGFRHQALLAQIYLRSKDTYALAKLPWNQMIYQSFMDVNNAATHLSERDHYQLARCARGTIDLYLSYAAAYRKGMPIDTNIAGSISLSKGSVFIAQSRYRSERKHPKLAPLFAEIDRINQRLAMLLAPGRHPDGAADDNGAEIQKLSEQRAALQIEVARRRSQLPQYMNMPVHMQMAEDAVLVDFHEYNHFSSANLAANDETPQRCLACLVCKRDFKQPYALVDLGPSEPIGELVKRWRFAIQKRRGAYARGFVRVVKSPDDDTHQLAQQLREKVWLPIALHLSDAKTVLLAPDGVLSFLPFAALPGSKKGIFLIEEHALAYTPVPHLIRPFRSFTTSPQPAMKTAPDLLLVGGVDFDQQINGKKKPASGQLHFDALPGTEKEIEQIAKLFRKEHADGELTVLVGARASLEKFRKSSSGVRWLHLATHGFFLPGEGDGLATGSGLAFAGANRGGGAGLLTALEVAGLDLARTEVTVLSACETSLGKVVRGEGVRGLQAAFQVAGSKTVLASLWPVDDEATQQLMVAFYGNLWSKKQGPLQALRQAQIDMLHGKLHQPRRGGQEVDSFRLSPYYWGAFVLSGKWN